MQRRDVLSSAQIITTPQGCTNIGSEVNTSPEVEASPIISGSVCKNARELSMESPIYQGKKRNCKVRYIESDSDEDVSPQPSRKIALPRKSKTNIKNLKKKSLLTEFQSPDFLNKRQITLQEDVISSPGAVLSSPDANMPDKSFEEHCVKRLKITNTETTDSPAAQNEKVSSKVQTAQASNIIDAISSKMDTSGCEIGADLSINTVVTDINMNSPQHSRPDKKKATKIKSESTVAALNLFTLSVSDQTKSISKSDALVKLVPDTEYAPDSKDYDSINDACWSLNHPVPYLALARTFQAIENTSSRLKIQSILTNYFLSLMVLATTEELISSVYLTLNKVGTSWSNLELGIGEGLLVKALAQATGTYYNSITGQNQ